MSCAESRGEKLHRILLWLGWAALLGVLCARSFAGGPTFDFNIFWHAARAVGEEGSFYAGSGGWEKYYFYGPIFPIIVWSLAWLALEPAFFLWVLGSAAAIPAAAIATGEVLRRWFRASLSPWILFGAMLVLIVPLASNSRHANVNTFLLLVHVLAYFALAAGRLEVAGLLLALAATFKVTPVLFLPWLILRKKWRGVAGFLAGVVLWVVLVPSLFYGPRRAMEETCSWVRTVLVPVSISGGEGGTEVLQHSGSSLSRVVIALLADRGKSDSEGESEKDAAPTLAIMSVDQAKVTAHILALGVILVTLLVTRREEGFGVVGFGLVAAAALIASPVSRSAHFVQLYPLVAYLMAMAFREDPSEKRFARLILIISISVMFLLLGAATLAGLSPKAFFYMTGFTLVLWSGGLIIVNRERESLVQPTQTPEFNSPGT